MVDFGVDFVVLRIRRMEVGVWVMLLLGWWVVVGDGLLGCCGLEWRWKIVSA